MKHFYFTLTFVLLVNFSFSQISFTKTQDLVTNSQDVTLFDKNNDGDLDVFFGKFSAEKDVIWDNNGSGTFTYAGLLYGSIGSSTKTINVLSFDYDNDNDIDLVSIKYDGSNSQVFQNNGTGSFTNSTSIATASHNGIYAVNYGDIDGDGDRDIIISFDTVVNGYYEVIVRAYTNDNNNFTASNFIFTSLNANDRTYGIELADIDNDGDLDYVLSMLSSVRVYKNNGAGGIVNTPILVTTATANYSIKTGDIDNDGDLDLVCSQSQYLKVWKNNGNSTFSAGQTLNMTYGIIDIELADINNDNYVDAILAMPTANKVLINTQMSNTFNDSGLSLGNQATYSIDSGDVNGDGKIDLIFANWDTAGTETADLWINNSTLSITENNIEKINLFPNPTNSHFKINANTIIEKVELYDVLGKQVKSFKTSQDNYNIEGLKSGIYFVKVFGNRTQQIIKLIKQNP